MRQAYAQVKAANSSLAARVGKVPWLEPLQDHNAAKKVSADEANSLAALAEGAWITQTTLCIEGKASTED